MRKSNMLISASILSVLAIGGIMAYFSSADSVTNRFNGHDLKILLSEPAWTPKESNTIVPNKKIEKNPYITNISDTDAYVFMQVTVPYADNIVLEGNGSQMYQSYVLNANGELSAGTSTKNGAEVAVVDAVTGERTRHFDGVELFRFFRSDNQEGFNHTAWTQVGTAVADAENRNITYVFAYGTSDELKILSQGESTETLFDYVRFINLQEGQGFEPVTNHMIKDYHIKINAYGIQTDHLGMTEYEKKNPVQVWNAYCALSGLNL